MTAQQLEKFLTINNLAIKGVWPVTYDDIKDRIQLLGYRASCGDITVAEKKELVGLLKKKKEYPEYETEQLKERYILRKLS